MANKHLRTFIKKSDGAKAPYAGRERASSTSAPPFTKLLIIFSQETLLWGAFCVEEDIACYYKYVY